MELNPHVAYYIIRFHAELMTNAEQQAQRHLFATMKATKGRSDEAAQTRRRSGKRKPTKSLLKCCPPIRMC